MRYIYEGKGNRLIMAGHTLLRGQPVELSGAAAEAADRHPSVRAVDDPGPAWGSTITDALAYVGDDGARAAEVLEAEKARGDDARKSLVTKLEATIDASNAGGGDNGGGGE